ncbi:hypothetical protein [Flavobacterium sp. ov086]|uniref:hypothetical protein n=1 Tax=Flavobacterium sp. ov086 TaxID=1761785 RepID=UPI000B753575|nr:hypothetical protein [Flavobacterium sp. ov086]SNR62097.1 hypothetical protein SAMN04487979_1147 [Flavobacterium sp. ov086]
MPEITTFETLDNEIKKFGGKPIVLEALWDGDTTGWFLCLFVYTKSDSFFNKSTNRFSLGHISLGGDIRLFKNEPFTEISLAKELGILAEKKYNLEFYFPSQNEPDDDCPKWSDRHLAINCSSCNKLIIPTTSPHLPKDICYNCYLEKERNQELINNKLVQDGVVLYLSNDEKSEKIGFYGSYDYLILSKFNIPSISDLDKIESIKVFTIPIEELQILKNDIEKELNLKLQDYTKPEINKDHWRFSHSTFEIEYQGINYTLETQRNQDHSYILECIRTLEYLTRAIVEKMNLQICFVRGLKYQDDSALRYLHYLKNDFSNIDELLEHYKILLSKQDILQTIENLSNYGCLIFDGFNIKSTELGKNIV